MVIIGTVFLSVASYVLYQDKISEDDYWDSALTVSAETQAKVDALSTNATKVSVGTYVENLKEISLKSSNFRLEFLVWFRWQGDEDLDMMNHFRVYKGLINRQEVVKEYHENGEHYQLVRVDATVTKNYWTRRFPLESHQLRFYLESEYLADRVVLIDDAGSSGYNRSLSIAGYELKRHATASYAMEYDSTNGDPTIGKDAAHAVTTEHVTALEINRGSWGLYIKCFIALFGTTTWVLITIFICTYHRVDPLGMIPAALFGTVSNIMVGANLLPDALEMGLLEFVNIWGIMTILAGALAIININRIRNKYEDRDFAVLYGRTMFITIVVYTLVGHLLLPLTAFMQM